MKIEIAPLEKLIDDIRLRCILDANYELFPEVFNSIYSYDDTVGKFLKSYNIKYKTNIELDSETELFWRLELS